MASTPPADGDQVSRQPDLASPSEAPDSLPHLGAGLRLVQTPTEEMRSLASLRRVGDQPVVEMDWYGEPAHLRDSSPGSPAVSALPADAAAQTAVGGVLFAALGEPGRPLVGRTLDGDAGPALVVRSHLTDGPNSVATLHLHQVGYTRDTLGDLRHPRGRQGVLRGQGGVVDGVNGHGVFVGLASDDLARSTAMSDSPRVGGLALGRLALDRARTAPEALEVFASVGVDLVSGSGPHFLLADREGNAAVVEFHDGGMQVRGRPDDQPWLCLPDPQRTPAPESRATGHEATCAARLRQAAGRLDRDDVTALLRELAGPHTQWSVCYDLAAGSMLVSTGRALDHDHEFTVPV